MPNRMSNINAGQFSRSKPKGPQQNRQNFSMGNQAADRKREFNPDRSFEAKKPRLDLNSTSVAPPSNYEPNPSSSGYDEECLKKLKGFAYECIPAIKKELHLLENETQINPKLLNHAHRLLKDELEKLGANMNSDWMDLKSFKSRVTLKKRIILPIIPSTTNIPGRLLGKGGSTLKSVCHKYSCSIKIFGAGSNKDPKKEAELLASGDPTYAHYAFPLHLEVMLSDQPHLAYERFGKVLNFIHNIIHESDSFELDGIFVGNAIGKNEQFNPARPTQQHVSMSTAEETYGVPYSPATAVRQPQVSYKEKLPRGQKPNGVEAKQKQFGSDLFEQKSSAFGAQKQLESHSFGRNQRLGKDVNEQKAPAFFKPVTKKKQQGNGAYGHNSTICSTDTSKQKLGKNVHRQQSKQQHSTSNAYDQRQQQPASNDYGQREQQSTSNAYDRKSKWQQPARNDDYGQQPAGNDDYGQKPSIFDFDSQKQQQAIKAFQQSTENSDYGQYSTTHEFDHQNQQQSENNAYGQYSTDDTSHEEQKPLTFEYDDVDSQPSRF